MYKLLELKLFIFQYYLYADNKKFFVFYFRTEIVKSPMKKLQKSSTLISRK